MYVSNLPKSIDNANVCICDLAAVENMGGIWGPILLRVTQRDVSHDLRAKVVLGTIEVSKKGQTIRSLYAKRIFPLQFFFDNFKISNDFQVNWNFS